jgi:hypothetical protein
MDDRVLYWLKGQDVQNFGDFLTHVLCERLLTGPAVVEAPLYRLVGSTIEYWIIKADLEDLAAAGVTGAPVYWGCGMRDVHVPPPEMMAAIAVTAVRGPLSRRGLNLPDNFPTGDPGLLLPYIHAPRPVSEVEGRILAIPHFNEPLDDGALLVLSGADVVLRPAVDATTEAALSFIDRLCAAEFALCGSLHAAIIAAAYGKPFAFWDTGHLDLAFKWRDFAASVDIPTVFTRNVHEARTAYRQMISPGIRLPDLTPLLASAPFKVDAGVAERVRHRAAVTAARR